jgi:hypothetical protein
MSIIQIPRNPTNIQSNIDILNQLGVKFEVQHGTYTTTIITDKGKSRYMMNSYNVRVFKCASLIKKDVLNSALAQEIMQSQYVKQNFGFSNNPKSYKAKKVLNIDISSAYATCLLRNGLITESTYKILKSLPKAERLPCVGMLATSHTNFFYENGECVNVETFRSKTANVFFFLIDEINAIMQTIQYQLGSRFIFYWVDGIFFDYNTDKQTVKLVEEFLMYQGYDYKYENVNDFKIVQDDNNLVIQMLKNKEYKEYTIGKDNVGDAIKTYLNENIKKQKNKPTTNKI